MEGALAKSGGLVGLGLVKSKFFFEFFVMTFSECHLGFFFGGLLLIFFFGGGRKNTFTTKFGVTKIKTCIPFYGHFHGKILGQNFPGLVQLLLSEVGSRCDNDESGSTVTMMMVFFCISKIFEEFHDICLGF